MYVRYDISVAVGSFCLFTSRLEQENKMKKTQRAVLQHERLQTCSATLMSLVLLYQKQVHSSKQLHRGCYLYCYSRC